MYRVLVVGGGASGSVAAISAARHGADVTLVEKMEDIGKKILATGNGRCNISNIDAQETGYHQNMPFISSVLSLFNVTDTLDFFEELGVMHRIESEGRVYPYSNQAASVVDVLKMEMRRLGINVLPKRAVTAVSLKKVIFEVTLDDGKILKSEKVILACGGKAGPQYGSNGEGYVLAKASGHKVNSPKPALVQMTHHEWYAKSLKGVRVKGRVALEYNKEIINFEEGEIQFTEDGLSGICIFNLSSKMNQIIESGESCYIIMDILNDIEEEELFNNLKQRRDISYDKTVAEFLIGLVNNKLGSVLVELAGIDSNKKCSQITNKELVQLKNLLKNWRVPVVGTRSFKHAQVTSGGIDAAEINPNTLESKIVKGLYFTGELVDVDGICGGYNLQWAWSSGYIAGKSAAEACFT